jgi:hypothetical protein
MHTLRRRCPGEACTASRTACVLLGKGSHHCFGVVDWADMEETDGRTGIVVIFSSITLSLAGASAQWKCLFLVTSCGAWT